MGEVQDNLFEPEFNRAIKVQGTDHRLTSNAGVVLLREADHRLGLLASIGVLAGTQNDSRLKRNAWALITLLGFSAALAAG